MSTYTIGDLVSVDSRATFRNDVQLSDFDDQERNLGLVRSYLFSSALPGRAAGGYSASISPAGVLGELIQAFMSDRLDNRFSLIATYGHGKSHLALALTNYFSKPYDSPEVQTLLEKLGNALGDAAKASRYDDFKNGRGEYLVLRLRGDVPQDLHTQVLQRLEKAFDEHEATRGQKIPFWFAEAERIISGFAGADREKANGFLEKEGYDVSLLLQRLARREDLYDLSTKLIHHVTGIRPNLGGEISLAEVVRWATDTFCGPGKLGGLLILFDEFSLYVQRYAQRSATGELQDLLNGVSQRQGKAAFLAFSQLDLMQLADNLRITADTRSGLKHELTRITKKWVLFSLMESVVDAYLVQDEKRWEQYLADRKISGLIYQATDVAWERFPSRYSSTLQWTFEQFQERVTRGCFPLHPITTYLLCNLRLQSDDAGVPRTVLGFVLGELRALKDQPAAENNRPNWVLPISLVDYFEGRLSGDVYSQYEAARRTIGNDAPEEQKAVLKALLLQFLAEVAARRDEQVTFLAHTAGLDESSTKQALRVLSDGKVIRYDPTYKVNTFWPASHQPQVLEETVEKKLTRFEWSLVSLADLDSNLDKLSGSSFGSFDVNVDWGHSNDWAAREYIATADLLSPELLRQWATRFGYNHRDVSDGPRSVVLWAVATNEDEMASLREQVGNVIQAAFSDVSENPPVLVTVVSSRPHPELVEAYKRYWALHSFTTAERDDAGVEMYEQEVKLAGLALLRALKAIRGDDQYPADIPRPRDAYMVPPAYVSLLRTTNSTSLKVLLAQLYKAAYPFAPNEFFTQYRVFTRGANKLRDAVRIASEALLRNASSDLKAIARTNSLVRDLCDRFLVQKWEMLTTDYRIREVPGNHRVREAWQYLDRSTKSDNTETKLRDMLFPLLNPPYGYDYNTAQLVFSAWFGYHRLDLEASVNGRRIEQKELADLLGRGSRDFFQAIAVSNVVAIKRRTMAGIEEVSTRIQNANKARFVQETAKNEVVVLRETSTDERYNVEIRNSAQQAAENLAQAIEISAKYDQQASRIKQDIVRARTAQELIALQKKIAQLPLLGNVEAAEDRPGVLAQAVEQRFAETIEQVCRDNESPSRLTEVGLKRAHLQDEKRAIAVVGLPNLVTRIDTALARLDKREAELRDQLERSHREKIIQETIANVDLSSSLKQLQAARTQLQELTDLTDKLEAERDRRLGQIEQAITNIEERVRGAGSIIDNVTTRRQLENDRAALMMLRQRCADTNLELPLEEQIERVEALRSFFEQVERETPRLESPEAAHQEISRLEQLLVESDSYLSEPQARLVTGKIERIRKGAEQQREDARRWLDEQEQKRQRNHSLTELNRLLANPPTFVSFLSGEELQSLVELQRKVQQQIDEDALIAIEDRFRQIKDRDLQEKCLHRLQQVLLTQPQ